MLTQYFKNLYQQTMQKAYALAHDEIMNALRDGGNCLDCGAGQGHKFELLRRKINLTQNQYVGIEWDASSVAAARAKGIDILHGDLNETINFPDNEFKCIFGLSVLEHLLRPCAFLRECHRCLQDGGTLIILTPNISTYFSVALLLVGKMPSSGPHPDSDALLNREELFKVSHDSIQPETEPESPAYRHLVVFSYRILKYYLRSIGFSEVKGYGFGLYPFPAFTQDLLERIDPYHCHQMLFIARK